jgi:RNA polymerase sigma factor (sigma-70 family)
MASDGSPKFPETSWSLVASAGGPTSDRSARALEKLCSIYWYPVYAYLRRRGHDIETARDLTQEFFTRLIEKKYVASAGEDRGRFRGFLLMALQRFLLNLGDHQRALKRGGGAAIESLDSQTDEQRYCRELAHEITPEALYERGWALMVLERARTRLKGRYPADRLAAMMPFLVGEASRGEYQLVAAQMGTSAGSLKVAVHRLRRQYKAALRAEIAETVAADSEVTDEIRYLLEVLSRFPKIAVAQG